MNKLFDKISGTFFKTKEQQKDKILQEIDSLKQKLGEAQEAQSSAHIQDWDSTQAKTGRTPKINFEQLEWFYKKESWVRACIDAIQRTAISNTFRLVPAKPDIDLTDKEVEPILNFFEKPNANDTFADIISEVIVDLHIYGDAYVEVVKSKKTKVPIGLFNVYAPTLRILVNRTGKVLGYLQIPKGSLYNRTRPGKPVFFRPTEIVHFKLPNPGNEVYGLSPLESLFLPLETDILAQTYNRNFFKNNATPNLHLDLGNCSPQQLKRVRAYFKHALKGVANSHKTLITEGGAVLKPIGESPTDMQFLEQRRFSRDEICAVLGCPPMKIGITDDVNRASALESDKSFKADKIIPLQRMIATKINLSVVSLFNNPRVKFAFSEIDLRDAKEQAQIDQIYVVTGVLTINEIRKRQGLKPIEVVEQDKINEQRKSHNLVPLIFGDSKIEKVFTF